MIAKIDPVAINSLRSPLARPVRTGRRAVLASLLGAAGFLAVSGLAPFGGASQILAAQDADPAAIIAAYVAAVNAGDLEGILALHDDDAVHIALPSADGSAGICRGKGEFRMWYEQSVAANDRVEVIDDSLAVDGNQATFTARVASDPWRELGLETLEAKTDIVVIDGRIMTHLMTLTPESVRQLVAARDASANAGVAVPHASHGPW